MRRSALVLLLLFGTSSASAVEVGSNCCSIFNGDTVGHLQGAQRFAATGAAWTRVNFRLDVWSAPDDPTPHGPENLTWFQTYDRTIDYLTTHGVMVYGEISGEAVPAP